MCGRFELKTKFDDLPKVLRKDYPIELKNKYVEQNLVKPNDPVLVIKNQGKIKTTFMYWGFISPWAKDPFEQSIPRPFNARLENVQQKKLFQSSWRYRRCLIPSTGFLEKGFRIRKKDYTTFWLGGIWARWTSADGADLESCCVLTTEANQLVKPLNHRMPVIIQNGYEEKWTENCKNLDELKSLIPIMNSWSSDKWIAEKTSKIFSNQISLF